MPGDELAFRQFEAMRREMKIWVAIVMVVLGLTGAAMAADVYVATNGNDANPGTEAMPFATLAGARDAIRAVKTKVGSRWHLFQVPFSSARLPHHCAHSFQQARFDSCISFIFMISLCRAPGYSTLHWRNASQVVTVFYIKSGLMGSCPFCDGQ